LVDVSGDYSDASVSEADIGGGSMFRKHLANVGQWTIGWMDRCETGDRIDLIGCWTAVYIDECRGLIAFGDRKAARIIGTDLNARHDPDPGFVAQDR
jgi:hypothetical protein